MSYQLEPLSINLLPEDVQQFRVRAEYPPIIWNVNTNSSIVGGQQLQLVPVLGGSALIATQLRSGYGSITWTLGPGMLPTGAGKIIIRLASSGPHLRAEISATTTNFFDENNINRGAVSHTVNVGDTYTLSVAGNRFVGYINGQYSSAYDAAVALTYPFFGEISWIQPFTVTPATIYPPVVAGDWTTDPELVNNVTWTHVNGPSGGTFNPSSGSGLTFYTVGSNPGTYTLQAAVGTGAPAVQRIQSLVVVEPLTILGLAKVTMQPGEQRRFPTNYDKSSKKLVTWSVASGGGTLVEGLFTAPASPGTSVVRASYGVQRAEVTVTILATLIPTQYVVEPSENITITTNLGGSLTWSASLGSLTGSGTSRNWTAPGLTGPDAVIMVTNGTTTLTLKIPVLEKFPYDPTFPIEFDVQNTAVIGRAEDRTRYSRIKDRDGLSYESHSFQFLNRDVSEAVAARAFYDRNKVQKRFMYVDKVRNLRKALYFNSPFRSQGDSSCSMDYSFQAVEG